MKNNPKLSIPITELIENHAKAEWFDGNEDASKILSQFGIALLERVKENAESNCTAWSKGSHVSASYACTIEQALEALRK